MQKGFSKFLYNKIFFQNLRKKFSQSIDFNKRCIYIFCFINNDDLFSMHLCVSVCVCVCMYTCAYICVCVCV